MEDETFDFRKALAKLAQNEPDGPGRKLSFHDQCAAFACIKNNIKTTIVAQTFGISRIAASQIAGCQTNARYQRVRAEFERLGEVAFERQYLDQALLTRLAKVKHDIDEERARFRRGAPTLKADRKSWRAIGVFVIDEGEFWRVSWTTHKTNPDLNGWYFAGCQANGDAPEVPGYLEWKGRESLDGGERRPFRTSGQAFNAAFAYCNRTPPK